MLAGKQLRALLRKNVIDQADTGQELDAEAIVEETIHQFQENADQALTDLGKLSMLHDVGILAKSTKKETGSSDQKDLFDQRQMIQINRDGRSFYQNLLDAPPCEVKRHLNSEDQRSKTLRKNSREKRRSLLPLAISAEQEGMTIREYLKQIDEQPEQQPKKKNPGSSK